MAHTRSWNEAKPDGGDFANQLDTQIKNDKVDQRERLEMGHYMVESTDTTAEVSDGRHKAGAVGCVFQGSTSQIDNLTAANGLDVPDEGSLAHDTTLNVLKRYDLSAPSDNWKPISNLGLVFYAKLGTTTVSKQAFNTAIICDSEIKDTAGQYDVSTGKFTAVVPGTYHVTGSVELKEPTPNLVQWEALVYKNGFVDPTNVAIRGQAIVPGGSATIPHRFVVSGYVNLVATDWIALAYNGIDGSVSATTEQIVGDNEDGWTTFGAHLVFADYTV